MHQYIQGHGLHWKWSTSFASVMEATTEKSNGKGGGKMQGSGTKGKLQLESKGVSAGKKLSFTDFLAGLRSKKKGNRRK